MEKISVGKHLSVLSVGRLVIWQSFVKTLLKIQMEIKLIQSDHEHCLGIYFDYDDDHC